AKRLDFLRTQIEQLKLAKEFLQTHNNLELLNLKKAKQIKTLQLDNDKLDTKRKSRGELDKLAHLKKRKELELEIAKLNRQIEDLKNPPKGEPKLSPEQEQAKRHAQSETRLENLKMELQKAMKISDKDERMRKSNAVNDAMQHEMVEWSKTLP